VRKIATSTLKSNEERVTRFKKPKCTLLNFISNKLYVLYKFVDISMNPLEYNIYHHSNFSSKSVSNNIRMLNCNIDIAE